MNGLCWSSGSRMCVGLSFLCCRACSPLMLSASKRLLSFSFDIVPLQCRPKRVLTSFLRSRIIYSHSTSREVLALMNRLSCFPTKTLSSQPPRLRPRRQGPVIYAIPPAPETRADRAPAHLRVPVPVLPADYGEVIDDALRKGHHDLQKTGGSHTSANQPISQPRLASLLISTPLFQKREPY